MHTDRNEVEILSTRITVTPRGLDFIWCFRKELSFPRAAVKSVRIADKSTVRRGIRTLGTDLGFKICGTFESSGDTNFWNYRSPGPVLVIELVLGYQFSKLYLSVRSPESVCERFAQPPHAPAPPAPA